MTRLNALLILAGLLLLSSSKIFAQTYVDYGDDGNYLYIDYYGDPSAGNVSCPSGVILTSTFAGATANAQAYYPNTAHISQSGSIAGANGNPYTWIKTYELLGQQRGGNCGGIATTQISFSIKAGVSFNVYKASGVVSGLEVYYPITPCTTHCQNGSVTGPSVPLYNYVLQNYNWLSSTPPVGNPIYICGLATSVISNATGPFYLPPPAVPNTPAPPGTPWTCYDKTLL